MVHVAGKPVLGHILDKLDDLDVTEIVFVTGDMEDQIRSFIGSNYDYKCSYVKQDKLLGDGHALNMAKDLIDEDVLVIFVDTIFECDLKSDIDNLGDFEVIVWTNKTDDPRRFGIVNTDGKTITELEEKPENPKSDLAVIGLYYFKDSKLLFDYLSKIIEEGKTSSGGEYRLADALEMMLSDDKKLKAETVDKWLDCGKPDTLLETNQYLLEHGKDKKNGSENTVIIDPVYIEDGTEIKNSVIGPFVSIAKNTKIKNCVIANSIIGVDSELESQNLEDSIIGDKTVLLHTPRKLNVGDNTQISTKK